ncbi:MAG: hypothetical protein ACI9C1_001746 [Candidatus Aldehydirespiratoraceae bacterium]
MESSPADVDATFAASTTADASVKQAPFEAPWRPRCATVFNPDGNPVDLYATLG